MLLLPASTGHCVMIFCFVFTPTGKVNLRWVEDSLHKGIQFLSPTVSLGGQKKVVMIQLPHVLFPELRKAVGALFGEKPVKNGFEESYPNESSPLL